MERALFRALHGSRRVPTLYRLRDGQMQKQIAHAQRAMYPQLLFNSLSPLVNIITSRRSRSVSVCRVSRHHSSVNGGTCLLEGGGIRDRCYFATHRDSPITEFRGSPLFPS